MYLQPILVGHVAQPGECWALVDRVQHNLGCEFNFKGDPTMRRLISCLAIMLISLLAVASNPGKQQIVDLTDSIRVGLVRETAGQAMIDKYGIHEVRLEPEMSFKTMTGRSTFLSISTQVGTHVDAGAHVMPDGWTVDKVDISRLIGRGVLVDVRAKTAEDPVIPADLEKYNIRPGDIVLFYFNYHPPKEGELYSQSYLTDETARWLVAHGVKCIASNTPGVENFKRGVAQHWTDPQNQKVAWPVHKILLSKQIPIIEGLTNLDMLSGHQFQFIALPLKIFGADGSPVRAIAILQ
jgi:kynurenine formamidase